MRQPLIGIVGKPSSGKSTLLNALTDEPRAAMGAFPFTTIEPNQAVGYLRVPCPCSGAARGLGAPEDGCGAAAAAAPAHLRAVPVMLLDVAGLVPGAHAGRGLGNKFLDDLRHADALVHVVDVSGTTDTDGRPTRGHDPLADVQWLWDEIRLWVEHNLRKRWPTVVRRHLATRASPADTLQAQLGGYGAQQHHTRATLRRLARNYARDHPHPDSAQLPPLELWDDACLSALAAAFVAERFPTVLALNKIDHPDADKNVSKIVRRYPDARVVLCSALTELFLRRLAAQRLVQYTPGTESVVTAEEGGAGGAEGGALRALDDKTRVRLEHVRDLVLYRFGSTGVAEVLGAAVEALELVPVWPVRSVRAPRFRECVLVARGAGPREAARAVLGGSAAGVHGLEGPLAEDAALAYNAVVGGP